MNIKITKQAKQLDQAVEIPQQSDKDFIDLSSQKFQIQYRCRLGRYLMSSLIAIASASVSGCYSSNKTINPKEIFLSPPETIEWIDECSNRWLSAKFDNNDSIYNKTIQWIYANPQKWSESPASYLSSRTYRSRSYIIQVSNSNIVINHTDSTGKSWQYVKPPSFSPIDTTKCESKPPSFE